MLLRLLLTGCLIAWQFLPGFSQALPDRVLTLSGPQYGARDLPQDRGAAGVWQKLLKLQTTGSVLHITAHPDDEHADLLTYLSRGSGVRTALLSLNRGEGGANVLGPELFDGLGLLRTEEMLLAGTYYGLDDLYFTDVADYGFSKRVAEAYGKWDEQHVLAEMVRVIRINRPLVLISRFHGSARDGHGNHQAAGELTQKAFRLAGDASAFPEQITAEGLRPWKPHKLYRGGIHTGEPHHYVLQSGEYCPWLGTSYKNFSLLGYSFHRSQFSGVQWEVPGAARQLYERLQPAAGANAEEKSPFAGLDVSIGGLFALTGETPPADGVRLLREIQDAIEKAVANFTWQRPQGAVTPLTDALGKVRKVLSLTEKQPEANFLLLVKERQLMDAIHSALGVSIKALAVPTIRVEKPSFFSPPPTLAAAVPAQPFGVEVTFLSPGLIPLALQKVELDRGQDWRVEPESDHLPVAKPNTPVERRFTVTLPDNTDCSGPYFYRPSLQANRYETRQPGYKHLPYGPSAAAVLVTYRVKGQMVTVRQPVLMQEANLPYGYALHTLKVLPAVAVSLSPSSGIILPGDNAAALLMQVGLINHAEGNSAGTLKLALPEGWTASPAEIPFTFTRAGEKLIFPVTVTPGTGGTGQYAIKAVAVLNGKEYTSGYERIAHRDQNNNYLFKPAETRISSIDVRVAPGLKVGYIMGAGDDIPSALGQLGVAVQLLTVNDLARADLQEFGAIMVGSRAYAVRNDLVTYNGRLLEYARNGGHLVVLYQTPEFVPDQMAPFPAQLPPEAEEVSEEDAPVEMVAPDHPLLNFPNKITAADFSGWLEQRGSKFFSRWDAAYRPVVSSHDQGQPPQRGGWLTAPSGKGHYTYFAYALHRQLPYGVPGAYRLLANLVSLGRETGNMGAGGREAGDRRK